MRGTWRVAIRVRDAHFDALLANPRLFAANGYRTRRNAWAVPAFTQTELRLDLDIDSDNTGPFALPDRIDDLARAFGRLPAPGSPRLLAEVKSVCGTRWRHSFQTMQWQPNRRWQTWVRVLQAAGVAASAYALVNHAKYNAEVEQLLAHMEAVMQRTEDFPEQRRDEVATSLVPEFYAYLRHRQTTTATIGTATGRVGERV